MAGFDIRELRQGESAALGSLMVEACPELVGFSTFWSNSPHERLGFARSEDLDFSQSGFPVFGFLLQLETQRDLAQSR